MTATGRGRSGCRAWDDPVQGRNTAVITQYRGVRVPRGRRQLHAGVPFPHEGCAVLLTGTQLLLTGRHLLLTGRHMLLAGRHLLLIGRHLLLSARHSSSTGGHFCLQVDTGCRLVTTSMINPACNLPFWQGDAKPSYVSAWPCMSVWDVGQQC